MTLGAGAAIAVALVWLRPPAMLKWRPVSPAAAQAIARCGSPLYNTYGQGGELIWFVPEQRVFIDNRQDPFPMDVLRLNRKLEHDGDVTEVFSRFGIQCAAVSPASLVAATLGANAGWTERYQDRQWSVFTRN
jgi:hypothetical protein